jgi:FkbM family methyltransferase
MARFRLFRRRPRIGFAEWGYEVRNFSLTSDGVVQYAQWQHPCERVQRITQQEVDGLRQFIRPGDFAIDIGAHTGDTTLPMALAAGSAGCVLALEPNRFVFKVLEANAGLNRDRTHIVPRCLAATAEDGQFVFSYGDASFCNGGMPAGEWNPFRRKYPLTVQGRNLLHLLKSEFSQWLAKLSYVKVDAEGYDRQILESIAPILRERKPFVRSEVFYKLNRAQRRALFDLLGSCGYQIFRFEGGDKPQGKPIDREHMSAPRHFDILAVPAGNRARLAA